MLNGLIETGFRRRPAKGWPTFDGKELDRTKYVTASEVGYCLRKAFFAKSSPEAAQKVADDFQSNYGAAERGHTAEWWIVDQLRRSGANLLFVGDDQVSFYSGPQSGTPDGVLRLAEEDVLLEFKSVDPRTNWSALPKKQHLSQVQQNMDLVQENLGFNVRRARLLYIDAANYKNRKEFEIEFSVKQADILYARCASVIEANRADDLEPEGVYNGDCKFCSFKGECSGAVEAEQRAKVKAKETNDVAKQFFG